MSQKIITEKDVFLLFSLLELKNTKEIAEYNNCTEAAVRQRLVRLKLKLHCNTNSNHDLFCKFRQAVNLCDFYCESRNDFPCCKQKHSNLNAE